MMTRFSIAGQPTAISVPVSIQPIRNGGGELLLSTADGNLRCTAKGAVDFKAEARGSWARWVLASGGSAEGEAYQSLGHRDAGRSVFLSVGEAGALTTSPRPVMLRRVEEKGEEKEEGRPKVAAAAPRVLLSPSQRKNFVQDGYLRLPSLVDQDLVLDALRHLNMSLAPQSGLWGRDASDDAAPSAHARSHPSIQALLYASPVHQIVEGLIGPATRPRMGQLALRFPNNKQDPQDSTWHIDGQKKWHKSPFQLLVGVALSAHTHDDCGNLAVWPATHGEVHAAAQRARVASRPSRAVVNGLGAVVAEQEADDDDDAEEDEGDVWHGQRPTLGSGAALQLHLEPGDVVLAHQKLPHRVSPNRSPHIRYMVYFRLSSLKHAPQAADGGLWEHFEGLSADLATE